MQIVEWYKKSPLMDWYKKSPLPQYLNNENHMIFAGSGLALFCLTKLINRINPVDRRIIHETRPDRFNWKDPHSFSNFEDIVTDSLHLNWEVDFTAKRIFGSVVLKMTSKADKLKHIDLDVAALKIHGVKEKGQGKLNFHLVDINNMKNILGLQLKIKLHTPLEKGQSIELTIDYETTHQSEGVCWLKPNQTVGKKSPYMFTLAYPCYGRSFVPCQDTPSIKAPYTAEVISPAKFEAYMSAFTVSFAVIEEKKMKWSFKQRIPVASYHIALLVGDVVCKKTSGFVAVISEPEHVSHEAKELWNMKEWLDALTSYLKIPYVWDQYRVCLPPPSFAFGGLEYPHLTFNSPTIILPETDASQTVVAIHEIGHSWTGNLVTCASWENVWLNEGLTMFIQRKALAKLFGKDAAIDDAYIGYKSLCSAIKQLGSGHNLTRLHPQLEHHNPVDYIGTIPKEKGYLFAAYLADLIGQERFREFLTFYLQKYQYHSLNDRQFQDTFIHWVRQHLPASEQILDSIHWDMWFFRPGLPTYVPAYKTKTIDEVTALAQRFIELNGHENPEGWERLKADKAPRSEQLIFLHYFIEHRDEVTLGIVQLLEDLYAYETSSKNAEIQSLWYVLCLPHLYPRISPTVAQFLSSCGDLNYIVPIYRVLADMDKVFARHCFENNSDFYQAIALHILGPIVGYHTKKK